MTWLKCFVPLSLALVALVWPLSACGLVNPGQTHIVLWHSWPDADAEMLAQAVSRYEGIFDGARVVLTHVPDNQMRQRYQDAVTQGLGPDLFIGAGRWARELHAAGQLAPVEPDLVDPSVYYAGALSALTLDDRLHGVPLSLKPPALIYNRNLVEAPPENLDALLQRASEGQAVGLNSRFERLLWGLSAFGGRLFDEEGRVVLDDGSLANWLNWLLTAEDLQSVVLSRDEATLISLFQQERLAYLSGTPELYERLSAAMGAENLSVTPFPQGPSGPAGPLLYLDALYFSPASSPNQHAAALNLASFLTNIEQSTTFMRELGRVPANRNVRVDPRAYPIVSAFLAQSRTATPISTREPFDVLLAEGDAATLRVLEGVLEPVTAVNQITTSVNERFGFEVVQTFERCELSGAFVMWHNWQGESAAWLRDVVGLYQGRCPDVSVDVRYVPQLRNTILQAQDEDAPDMLIGPSAWLIDLLEADMIQSVPRERLQPYRPIAQQAVRYQDTAYGLPITLETTAFYVNAASVADPAVTLDDLSNQIQQGNGLAFATAASESIWGWTATGALRLDETGQLSADAEGVRAWLRWLQTVSTAPEARLSENRFLLNYDFQRGNVAYYIGNSTEMLALRDVLGDDLAVSLLPSGPGGPGQPRVQAQTFYFHPRLNDTTRPVALDVVDYLTSAERQDGLVTRTGWLPANATSTVSLETDPLLNQLLEQARTGQIIAETDANRALLDELNALVTAVLAGELAPDEATLESEEEAS